MLERGIGLAGFVKATIVRVHSGPFRDFFQRSQQMPIRFALLAREDQVRGSYPRFEFLDKVTGQRNLPLLVILCRESALRMVTDCVNAIGEINVSPTGVHDFLFPRTRTEEELKRKKIDCHSWHTT